MLFDQFILDIPKLQNLNLPAQESHLKLAPFERAKMLNLWKYEELNPKKAGVLALIYPKNSIAHIVLIIRTSKGIHSSQVAFPGGKYEDEDISLENTAIRETFEEIGVDENQISIIKNLSKIYVPPSNFLVYPFIAITKNTPKFKLCQEEVDEIIEIPLSELINTQRTEQLIKASYSEETLVPVYLIKEKIIWGATAMILSELKDLLSNKQ